MKKLLFACILGAAMLLNLNVALAQENRDGSMRQLAIESMQEYGRQLFNRGDYKEAQKVFKRILSYDATQQPAQDYLISIDAKLAANPQRMCGMSCQMAQIKPLNADNLDADLAQLQQGLHQLRESLRTKVEQLKTLGTQIP